MNCQRDIRFGASSWATLRFARVFGERARYRADWLTFTPVEADIVRSGDGLFGQGKIQWLSRAKGRVGEGWEWRCRWRWEVVAA